MTLEFNSFTCSELFNMRNQPDLCNLLKCIVLSIWSLGNKGCIVLLRYGVGQQDHAL
jgi:hypothetical protein